MNVCLTHHVIYHYFVISGDDSMPCYYLIYLDLQGFLAITGGSQIIK